MRVYVAQASPVSGDPAANLGAIERGLAVAAAAGAELAVFPELFVTGYNLGTAVHDLAEAEGAGAERTLVALAKAAGVALVAGLPQRAGNTVRNVALCVDGNGTVLARYAKRHLFGDAERAIFTPGKGPAVVELGDRKVGLSICYDIEFPEVARELARAGAEIILVPTANMTPFWDVPTSLIRARALENGVAVVYANLCGEENGMTYTGLSVVVGPDGRDLARAGTGEVALIADLGPALDAARVAPPSTQLADLARAAG
ncbi:MAG: carbon-nitrogen hydrolase family protein [Pseudomonadota bacterium]